MGSLPLTELEARIGVRFKDADLLRRALTHRSAAATGAHSYERLEFLGDSIVGLVISELLFKLFPDRTEGDLAKAKAYVVSAPALAEAAERLGLYDFIVVSAGEDAAGGRRRNSIMADAFEALVAAVYLDAGIRSARALVRRALSPALREVADDTRSKDYKSALQEQTQARTRQAPVYTIVSETGRAHEKVFTAGVRVNGDVAGEGTGASKKEAEQAAAKDALARLAYLPPSAEAEGSAALESG